MPNHDVCQIVVIMLFSGAIFDHEDKAAKTGFLYGITRFNTDREESFQLAVHLDVIDLADSFKLAESSKLHMYRSNQLSGR